MNTQTEPNDSEKKKKSIRINSLFEHVLVTTFIVGIVGFVMSDYFSFKKEILEGYWQIQNSVEDMIFLDEVTYKFCTLYRVNTCSVCGCFNNIEEYKALGKMSIQFSAISHSLRKLGKFVPYETYEAVHQLDCWQNILMSSKAGICKSNLLGAPRQMDLWRNKIADLLEEDRSKYQSLFYSVGGYLSYIFTDKIDEQYVPKKCSLNHGVLK